MVWGSGILKANQQKLISTILAACFSLSTPAYALESPLKEARLNMGYYASSITEQASRTDVEVSLNFWVRDLIDVEAKKNHINISSSKAILFDRIEDMEKAFEQGELDMIIAPPLLIARYFKREDLGDGFVGVLQGKKPDSLLLIARTDKNINRVKDLRGKRLVMQDNDELADIFIDTLMLTALKLSYKNIGLSVQYQNKPNRIILDVFFDKADVAVVYSSSYDIMTELNPSIKNSIKVLAEYPMKSKNFSYFRQGHPLITELTALAMVFNNSPRGKQILEVFRTPEIDYCKVSELDVFDKYYKDYLQLKRLAKK